MDVKIEGEIYMKLWQTIRWLLPKKKRPPKEELTLLEEGTRVLTTRESLEVRNNWSKNFLEERKWGVQGKINRNSILHGLCYVVEHEDGTVAWYAPDELQVIDVPPRRNQV